MNLKSKIITLIVVLIVFVCGPAYSQGVFKNQSETSTEITPTNGGTVRAPGPRPDQPPGQESSPVGEGLLILSLLSGGYFMLKKKNSEK